MKLFLKLIPFTIFYLLCLNKASCQAYELIIKTSDSLNFYAIESISFKKTHATKIELLSEIETISEKLSLKGFIHNTYVIFESSNTIICTFNLHTKISEIRIFYNDSIPELKVIKQLSKKNGSSYFEIPIENVKTVLNKIKDEFIKKGFSFTKVSLQNIQCENNILFADLSYNFKQKRTIDKVVIKGYLNFPQKYIKNALGLKKKTLFNLENLNSIEKQLNSIPFIEQVKKPEVLFSADSTLLYIYLKKRNINQFDGVIGFSTDETSKRLKVNGNINLLLNNTFNNGETINLIWNNNGKEKTSLFLNFINPYIFKSKFTVEGFLNIQKNDSTFTNRTTELRASYTISKNQKIGGVANFSNSNTLAKNEIENYENYNKHLFGFSYSLKSILNPKNLLSLNFNYLFGNRITDLKKENQSKFELNAQFLKTINLKNRIYLKNTTKILNSDAIFQNELFQIGGVNSLRGFNELSIETSSYTISTVEYHYYISNTNFLYTVTDFGFIKKNDPNTALKNLIGLGFGYSFFQNNTTINLSYVVGKSNLESFKFNNAKLHIKLTYLF